MRNDLVVVLEEGIADTGTLIHDVKQRLTNRHPIIPQPRRLDLLGEDSCLFYGVVPMKKAIPPDRQQRQDSDTADNQRGHQRQDAQKDLSSHSPLLVARQPNLHFAYACVELVLAFGEALDANAVEEWAGR